MSIFGRFASLPLLGRLGGLAKDGPTGGDPHGGGRPGVRAQDRQGVLQSFELALETLGLVGEAGVLLPGPLESGTEALVLLGEATNTLPCLA